jgi:regulator of RNase E activity RraA
VAEKRLTGRIARERIRMLEVPRPPQGVVERFKALGDCTGIISDTMDVTLRNILQRIDPLAGAREHVNKMAEFECHNLAQSGDVLVIQGVPNVSNMGGISAQTGKRQGEVGAIVEGGVRDIAHSRAIGYPVWASDITPVTGKWRLEAAEINGVVEIGGVQVAPGDLVVADDTGVAFIPRDMVLEVLEEAEKKARAEDVRCKAIDGGVPVPDISKATYGET